MYNVSNILENKKYPEWIIEHPIFKDVSIYDKIFPKKGLNNSSAPLTTLLGEQYLECFIKDVCFESEIISVLLKGKLTAITESNSVIEALIEFFNRFSYSDYIEIKRDNKISAILSEDIYDSSGSLVFRKGSSLFSLLEKTIEQKIGVSNFFAFDSFKDFSRLNIPLSSAQISFSTDPWDIATMSMRGITTCQSWNGEYRQSLIGSMLDPYVGIVFLESKGKPTEYGSKMLYRSTVRFAVDNTKAARKKQPVLILDHIYPECFTEIFDLFSKFLTEKSGLKVILAADEEQNIIDGRYFLPRSKIKDSFKFYSENETFSSPLPEDESIRSYQNNPIKDKPPKLDNDRIRIEISLIKSRFVTTLIRESSTSGIELSRFSSDKINALIALKNKNFIFKDQIKNSIRTFSNLLISNIDISQERDFDKLSASIKLYLNYFHKRNYLLESISSQVTQWNGALALRKTSSLTKRDFVLIMEQVMKRADNALKAELKALFAARRLDNARTSD
jgi:hypothetical protein